jgi:hypothetical protein
VSPAGNLVFTMPIPVFTMPILAFTFRRSCCSRCSDPRVHDGPKSALAAIRKAEWDRARRLLRLRLEMRHRPDADDAAAIERVLRLIDEAETKGIGPDPA